MATQSDLIFVSGSSQLNINKIFAFDHRRCSVPPDTYVAIIQPFTDTCLCGSIFSAVPYIQSTKILGTSYSQLLIALNVASPNTFFWQSPFLSYLIITSSNKTICKTWYFQKSNREVFCRFFSMETTNPNRASTIFFSRRFISVKKIFDWFWSSFHNIFLFYFT